MNNPGYSLFGVGTAEEWVVIYRMADLEGWSWAARPSRQVGPQLDRPSESDRSPPTLMGV